VLVAVPTVIVLAGAIAGITLVATHVSGSKQNLATSHEPVPPAVLRLAHMRHHAVPFDRPLTVAIKDGALSSVVVNVSDGQQIDGTFNRSHSRWRSGSTFTPRSPLRAQVRYTDLAHHVTTRTLHLRTTDSKRHLDAILSPGGGDTVGVGSPVEVIFDQDVPTKMRAEVESRLSVVSRPAVVGAWHWMSAREVHWRPPTYWKPGTRVTVSSDLEGLDLGHGIWGEAGSHTTSFKIGDAHVSEVNIGAHVMHVYDNGQLIRTFPVSTGRDQYPTMDGVHIAIEKSAVVQMNSATVGILPGNPDYYNETVYWDVRISDGGEFVHAAPWSVADQGRTNVSHGCVNLSTTDAEWFYNWAMRGDIIDVFNGVRPPSPTDPGTADWNMTWKQWVAGGAAPTQAALALHAPIAHLTEPGFAPAPTSHSTSHSKSHSTSKAKTHSKTSGKTHHKAAPRKHATTSNGTGY
jgi:lipoprotein-anchoring transpeptidase ErfK/SrfK